LETVSSGAVSRPLVWLNLCCLDAPLVAVAWQWMFLRSAHVTTTPPQFGALFFTAWLIYLVDRLADSISLPDNVEKSARQIFCQNHTTVWLIALGAVALFDFAIVITGLDWKTLFDGFALAAVAAIYLIVNLYFSRVWESIPVKEIVIGTLFAAGTVLCLVGSSARPRGPIVLVALLFAALCAFNCISIATWERNLDRLQSKCSIATRWPQIATFIPTGLILLATAASVLALAEHSAQAPAICVALSAAFLAGIHFIPVNRDERTALADLVLLTPVCFLILEKTL
jgi:hypothetical protein